MTSQHLEPRDAKNANLLNAVAVVGRALGRLRAAETTESTETIAELRASWGALVDLLALQPALELRACPACKGIAMSAATRCSCCWGALTPEAPSAATKTESDASVVRGSD